MHEYEKYKKKCDEILETKPQIKRYLESKAGNNKSLVEGMLPIFDMYESSLGKPLSEEKYIELITSFTHNFEGYI